jgi:Carboxypeptidase regulatory-like domain
VRTLAIVAASLLFTCVARSECVEVQSQKPTESSEFPHILVITGGKPQSGVRVRFNDKYGEARATVTTDASGRVSTELAPGDYNVVASISEDVSASVVLRVIREHEPTTISIDLTAPLDQSQRELRRAESLPIQYHLHTFAGNVIDPSGAAISGAFIKVLKKGADGTVVVLAKADENGKFSSDLAEGLYVAFVSMPGFRTRIVPFEITKAGSGIAQVTLQIGSC